jgi:RNA polymerase sigma factor (sigma-70 family)
MGPTDTELILASRSDPSAFRTLYDRWAEQILAYFYRRTTNAEVSADLLAETFAVAWERAPRYRDRGAPGGAWLYGIARNLLSHYFRHRHVELRAVHRLGLEVPMLDQESAREIERLVESEGHAAALEQALTSMSPAEREAVELRVVRELDYAEIAGRLNCTEGAARVRVHRGLERLNQLLEGQR